MVGFWRQRGDAPSHRRKGRRAAEQPDSDFEIIDILSTALMHSAAEDDSATRSEISQESAQVRAIEAVEGKFSGHAPIPGL
jgi:hypothetical protein